MDILIIALLVFLVLIIISVVTFGVMILRKGRLKAKVLQKNKKFLTKTFTGQIGDTIIVGDGEYFVDDKCFISTFWGNDIYYYHGNPNPIDFNFDYNQPKIVGTKSQDLKTFHESDLIKKLFTFESLENIIMYLCIGIALLCVGILIVILTKTTPTVTLTNNANNTEIIANAVKIALRGG